MASRLPLLFVLAASLACDGQIGDTPDPLPIAPAPGGPRTSGPGELPTGPVVPPAELPNDVSQSDFRRLSHTELAGSIEAIVGFRPALTLPGEPRPFDFERVETGRATLDAHVDGYAAAADAVWTHWSNNGVAEVSACDGIAQDAAPVSACAEELTAHYAPLALRRPISVDERARWHGRYESAESHGEGLRYLAHSLFRHPEFLYIIERPDLAPADEEGALGAYELATRVSLALCERTPDASLAAAAADGSILEDDVLAAQADRLLTTCGADTFERFIGQWLGLEAAGAASPGDRATMPEFTEELIAGMDAEWRAYARHVAFDTDGTFRDLLAGDTTVADARLSAIYPDLDLSAEPAVVTMPDHRRGILGLAALLSKFSHGDETHPIRRGVFLLKRIMCQPLSMEDDVTFPPPTPGLTNRERWDEHTNTPGCAVCHGAINPAGFTFEDFDSIGRYRTMDGEALVDATGDFHTVGIESVDGGADAATALAGSEEVAYCFARHWFRFGTGRLESERDATALHEMAAEIRDGAPIRSMLRALVTSYAFRHRRATTPTEEDSP